MANFADLWDANAETSVKSDFNSRLNAARNAWQAQTGKTLPVTSGYRTTEEQAKLFAQRGSNPNLVAKPGTSLHEKGEAADIPTNIPDSFLSQFGLHRPFGKKDPVHVQADPNFKPQASAQPSSNFADLWESSQQAPEAQVKKPSGFMETMTAANKTNAPLAQGFASLADTVTGIIPSAISTVAYPVARAFQQSPEEATKIAQKLSEPFSQPFGKAFGATETEAYKNEATRMAMDAIGQYVGEKADVIAQKTGIPKADVENMLGTIATAFGGKLPTAKGALPKLQAEFERRFPKFEEVKTVAEVKPEPTMAGVGAAKTEINPYVGKITV